MYTQVIRQSTFTYRDATMQILHNTNGPAIVTPNTKQWYFNGTRHRTDGPAAEYACGTNEWWVNGKWIRTEKSNG